ncbi:hypothetical protein J6590_070511, partial [Homalodisca vitripennis]
AEAAKGQSSHKPRGSEDCDFPGVGNLRSRFLSGAETFRKPTSPKTECGNQPEIKKS